MNIAEIKSALKDECLKKIEEQISVVRGVIKEYQSEANDIKNSGEDKFDSQKEDYQNKVEAHKKQLAVLAQTKILIEKIEAKENDGIFLGSIIETNEGNYFISGQLSIHSIEHNGNQYIPVSFASPIIKAFRASGGGRSVRFRDREINILRIF